MEYMHLKLMMDDPSLNGKHAVLPVVGEFCETPRFPQFLDQG